MPSEIICSWCQASEVPDQPKFKRCARCKVSTYCSKDCQRRAWSWHKQVCAQPLPTSSPEYDAYTRAYNTCIMKLIIHLMTERQRFDTRPLCKDCVPSRLWHLHQCFSHHRCGRTGCTRSIDEVLKETHPTIWADCKADSNIFHFFPIPDCSNKCRRSIHADVNKLGYSPDWFIFEAVFSTPQQREDDKWIENHSNKNLISRQN